MEIGIPDPDDGMETDAFDDAVYYVETETNLIYEVKFFDGFVLARPASPAFYLAIRKIDILTFSKEFHEYSGDSERLRAYLWGVEGVEPLMLQ
jgi:hypothetical protein